jgi:tetratricopeptide (TPR) repeat protein
VAESGRATAGVAFQAAVDTTLAEYWMAVYKAALGGEAQGRSGLVVQSARAAAPYLMRQSRWQEASRLLEQILPRDSSPGAVAAVLPLLRRIAAATQGTEQELTEASVLASALALAGQRVEAEAMLRDIARRAAEQEQFSLASATIGDLVNLLRHTGRLEEALALVDTKKNYSRLANLGPWTQLATEVTRLQVLNQLGRHGEVLSAVQGLRRQLQSLPQSGDQKGAVQPWNVQEVILEVGRDAAQGLERWDEALALNGEVVALRKSRGTSALDVARTRYNDYGPLLRLGRFDEAGKLLLECRGVFGAEGGPYELGMVYSALGTLEDELGHSERASDYQQTALRYRYLVGDPGECAISHFNLAISMRSRDATSAAALAHRLACAVIRFQTADGRLPEALRALSEHLASFTPAAPPLPPSFDALCEIVEQVEGVHFRDLFSRLPTTRAATGDEALQKVLGQI